MVTESGDLVVLAVHRKGEDLGPGATVLAAGDVMLLRGTWEALAINLDDPDVLVVDEPQAVRRQAVPFGPGAKRTVVVVAAMVVLLATGAVPAAVAGLLAAGALILTRVLSVEQAYRGINWTTIVLVGGMIPLSTAMQTSGAADKVADRLLDIVGGPYTLLIGLFVVIAVLGQLISNTATALIIIPVALAACAELDISVRPVHDVRHRRVVGGVAHARRHARQPDGDGPGRLSLRRLRQARPAAARLVLRRLRWPRPAVLAVLTSCVPRPRRPRSRPRGAIAREQRTSQRATASRGA